jgi:hypothetical protein
LRHLSPPLRCWPSWEGSPDWRVWRQTYPEAVPDHCLWLSLSSTARCWDPARAIGHQPTSTFHPWVFQAHLHYH